MIKRHSNKNWYDKIKLASSPIKVGLMADYYVAPKSDTIEGMYLSSVSLYDAKTGQTRIDDVNFTVQVTIRDITELDPVAEGSALISASSGHVASAGSGSKLIYKATLVDPLEYADYDVPYHSNNITVQVIDYSNNGEIDVTAQYTIAPADMLRILILTLNKYIELKEQKSTGY